MTNSHLPFSPYVTCSVCDSHLLPCEDVLIEEVLELFVGNVNTQLLKAVLLKLLKPKDVQDVQALRASENSVIRQQLVLICFQIKQWNLEYVSV